MTRIKDFLERFWSKVDIRSEDECWPWKAAKSGNGYGHMWVRSVDGKKSGVRVSDQIAWELTFAQEFPKGLESLHSCDNCSCCNPYHITPATHLENVRDCVRKGRCRKKLTAEIVQRLRQTNYKRGEYLRLARKHGVQPTSITNAITGFTWKHI